MQFAVIAGLGFCINSVAMINFYWLCLAVTLLISCCLRYCCGRWRALVICVLVLVWVVYVLVFDIWWIALMVG